HLPLIEITEASALHRRDMHENVLAAVLGLDEAITFGRIEPFHGTRRHRSHSPIRRSRRGCRRLPVFPHWVFGNWVVRDGSANNQSCSNLRFESITVVL